MFFEMCILLTKGFLSQFSFHFFNTLLFLIKIFSVISGFGGVQKIKKKTHNQLLKLLSKAFYMYQKGYHKLLPSLTSCRG